MFMGKKVKFITLTWNFIFATKKVPYRGMSRRRIAFVDKCLPSELPAAIRSAFQWEVTKWLKWGRGSTWNAIGWRGTAQNHPVQTWLVPRLLCLKKPANRGFPLGKYIYTLMIGQFRLYHAELSTSYFKVKRNNLNLFWVDNLLDRKISLCLLKPQRKQVK